MYCERGGLTGQLVAVDEKLFQVGQIHDALGQLCRNESFSREILRTVVALVKGHLNIRATKVPFGFRWNTVGGSRRGLRATNKGHQGTLQFLVEKRWPLTRATTVLVSAERGRFSETYWSAGCCSTRTPRAWSGCQCSLAALSKRVVQS